MIPASATVAVTTALSSALLLQAHHFELRAVQEEARQEAADNAHDMKVAAEKAEREREARERAERRRERRRPVTPKPPAPAPAGSPRDIARALVSAGQFACLDRLWTRESGWRTTATNPSSGAYGIPQALPASKMASAGPDWRTNPRTQIRWGLSYIRSRYGSPCSAWAHSQATGWY